MQKRSLFFKIKIIKIDHQSKWTMIKNTPDSEKKKNYQNMVYEAQIHNQNINTKGTVDMV